MEKNAIYLDDIAYHKLNDYCAENGIKRDSFVQLAIEQRIMNEQSLAAEKRSRMESKRVTVPLEEFCNTGTLEDGTPLKPISVTIREKNGDEYSLRVDRESILDILICTILFNDAYGPKAFIDAIHDPHAPACVKRKKHPLIAISDKNLFYTTRGDYLRIDDTVWKGRNIGSLSDEYCVIRYLLAMFPDIHIKVTCKTPNEKTEYKDNTCSWMWEEEDPR